MREDGDSAWLECAYWTLECLPIDNGRGEWLTLPILLLCSWLLIRDLEVAQEVVVVEVSEALVEQVLCRAAVCTEVLAGEEMVAAAEEEFRAARAAAGISNLRGRPRAKWRRRTNSASSTIQYEPKSSS